MNPPINWGVLGCARVFERRMAPGFAATPSARLLAIASRDQEKADVTAKKHGIERAYGSYEELLADAEIDAVFLPLPNDLHAHWAIRALDAGKHVLCDKPLALTIADAEAMALAAKSAGRRLMEGFMFRHHPQHARAKEIVDSGAIGALSHFSATFAYPAARDLSNIRFQKARGGGALLDVGVYGINAARYHFGSEPTDAVALSVIDPETGVDIRTVATLAFPGGKTAQIACGFDQAFASRYELSGTGGSILAERAFQIGENGVTLAVRPNNSDEVSTEDFRHADQYAAEIAHFVACVRDPEKPLWPGEDGVAQARAVDLARRNTRAIG